VVGIPVTLPLSEIVERLNAARPALVVGYATVLAQLAHERSAGRLTIDPQMVTSTSEMLTPDLRRSIREGLGAPVIDSFASTEGLAGSTAPDETVFMYNSDVCVVELVDADNRPTPVGEESTKILVTHLVNRVQPLIRYEMEDRFVQRGLAGGYLCATVVGRDEPLLRFDEVTVHPHVIRSVLLSQEGVVDYQVRQTPRGVRVDVLGDELELAAIRTRIAGALGLAGLSAPEVNVQRVQRFERDCDSGKLRRLVPLAVPG
jgi:phenylacetate-coenzyme A ligase PaaK-like adenylate-forming protein